MSTLTHPAESERLALPAADVAKLLGISERHLWACHSSGKLSPRPIAFGGTSGRRAAADILRLIKLSTSGGAAGQRFARSADRVMKLGK